MYRSGTPVLDYGEPINFTSEPLNLAEVSDEIMQDVQNRLQSSGSENEEMQEQEESEYITSMYLPEPDSTISTADIKNYYDNIKEITDTKAQEAQSQLELKLTPDLDTCESTSVVYNFNPQEFTRLLKDQFYNYTSMQTIKCLVKYLAMNDLPDLPHQILIRKYFRNLHKINYESVYGNVYNTIFDSVTDKIVLKTRSDKIYTDYDIIHELFVGTILNQTRKDIPNFVFTFGSFDCSKPFGRFNRIFSYCKRSEFNIKYLMLENIVNSISLGDYLQTDDYNFMDFLAIYLQVLYALNYANQEFKFTHYDLHASNVLLVKYDDQIQIPYTTENGTEYLRTKYLAYIIDFGYSYLQFEGKNFGIYGKRKYAVFQNAPYFLYDAYKLLTVCMSIVKGTINFNDFIPIFYYFNLIDDPIDAISDQNKYHYFIPPIRSYPDENMLMLTRFIRDVYGEIDFIQSERFENVYLLNCMNGNCEDSVQINLDLNIDQTPPKDMIELLEYLDSISEQVITVQKEALIQLYYSLEPEELKDLEFLATRASDAVEDLKKNYPNMQVKFDPTTDYTFRLREYLYDMILASDNIDEYLNEHSVYKNANKKLFGELELKFKVGETRFDNFKLYSLLKIQAIQNINKMIPVIREYKFPRHLYFGVPDFYKTELVRLVELL